MAVESDVVVIGAGIHGCCTALHLARLGWRVQVLEKGVVGRQASGVNAGGVRQLMRDPAEIPLSRAAMDRWLNLERVLGAGLAEMCEFRGHVGQIGVAGTQSELDWCVGRVADLRAAGHEFEEVIDRDELGRLIPAVSDHCLGGIISREDGHASPAKTNQAFRLRAEELGATFSEGVRVQALEQAGSRWRVRTSSVDHEAPVVVNCGGAWGSAIAAMMGDHLPVHIRTPSMMVTSRMPKFIEPVVIGIERALSLKQTENGTVVVGGGVPGIPDIENGTAETVAERMAGSARTVLEFFPVLRDATVVRTWAALEGRTPDDLPIIGPSASVDGFWHVFGFSGGFQLGTVVGQVVAETVVEGRSRWSIDAFSPSRFGC